METVTFDLPIGTYEFLVNEAELKGVSLNQLVVETLNRLVDKRLEELIQYKFSCDWVE